MRKKNEESINTNEWLNTYADVVTLLLTFFVLLFSFSSIDAQKWKNLVQALGNRAESFVEASHSGDSKSHSISSASEIQSLDDRFKNIYDEVNKYIQEKGLADKIGIEKGDTFTLLRFKDNVLFNEDRSELRPDGIEVLNAICVILKNFNPEIQGITVAGHTADRYQTGRDSAFLWNLSVSRAVSVTRYMIEEEKLDPVKISAEGYSKYHPLATNDNEEGRKINRRVEVKITKKQT